MISNETIYALSSAPGKAGVAVIRLSGPGAAAVAAALAGEPVALDRRARLRQLRHPQDGRTLDTALVLGFAGPASFTGEDVVELHVHGGRAVLEAVLDGIAATGKARTAAAGEFTRRAFDAGKLDLTEVEGLADLVDAETEAQRRQALRQMSGALGGLYTGWRTRLVAAMAHFEAGIDFIDEGDVPAEVAAAVRPEIEALITEMRVHLDDARRGEILRDGYSIAIIGPPNAGKSSVLNYLAGRDAAIVSTQAGTTRDVVEVRLDLGGYPVVVADTAGLRDCAGDDIEAEGMRRARLAADAADLRLLVLDGAVKEAESGLRDVAYDRILVNKSDLSGWAIPAWAEGPCTHAVSARTGTGFTEILEHIRAILAEFRLEEAGPPLTRTRHREAIEGAIQALERSLSASGMELAAEELRSGASVLARVVGAVDVEDLLDVIFRDFCIGK